MSSTTIAQLDEKNTLCSYPSSGCHIQCVSWSVKWLCPKGISWTAAWSSLSLFRQGKSVAEIAEERKLTLGTIEVHLLHFITEGEVNVDELISTEKQTLIRAAIKTNADGGFTKLMEGLPKEIGYNQIRMVLAADNKL